MNKLQKEILAIYKEFKTICDKNDLRFFANGGTAIGAVRHGGFIPWDDDLDVMMPRPDYEKFLKIAKTQLPEHLSVIDGERHTSSSWMFAKIQNVNTAFLDRVVIEADQPENFWGIYIDIMTLDGFPEGADEGQYFAKIQEFIHQKNTSGDPRAGKMFHEYVMGTDYDTSKLIAKTSGRGTLLRKEWLERYTEVPFEDTMMRICNGNDEFLTRYIGDYMKLPPEEERVAPHESFVDYERPYTYYQEEYLHNGLLKMFREINLSNRKIINDQTIKVQRLTVQVNRLQGELARFLSIKHTVRRLASNVKRRIQSRSMNDRTNSTR